MTAEYYTADHYAWGSSRPSTWSSSDYTAQYWVSSLFTSSLPIADRSQGWTGLLARNLSLPANSFVAGGFAEDPTSAAPMTTVSIINEGIETSNSVKLYAQHTYQYSTCDPARNAIATLPHLVDHQNIVVSFHLLRG
jgi:hypothetical protein